VEKNADGNWTVNWKDGDQKDRENNPEAHFNEILEVAKEETAATEVKKKKN